MHSSCHYTGYILRIWRHHFNSYSLDISMSIRNEDCKNGTWCSRAKGWCLAGGMKSQRTAYNKMLVPLTKSAKKKLHQNPWRSTHGVVKMASGQRAFAQKLNKYGEFCRFSHISSTYIQNALWSTPFYESRFLLCPEPWYLSLHGSS